MVMADLFQNFRALDVDNSSIAPNYNDILADKDMYGIDQQNPTSYCNQGDKESGGHAHQFRSTSERSGAHMYHLFIDEN